MIDINVKSKVYANQQAGSKEETIANFQLTIKDKEIVCLLGASGCGKSTLLNIIAGLDRDFKGFVQFNQGTEQPTIGYVFQNPRLLPWRTVRENIELVVNKTMPSSTIDDLLEIMQLTAYQKAYPGQLSLGMSRRVAIIRAFAINPAILLLDEPFVSLDADAVKTIMHLLIQLWQQHQQSVLLVTHDIREAFSLADRIIFLSDKAMQISQEIHVTHPREVLENPEGICLSVKQ